MVQRSRVFLHILHFLSYPIAQYRQIFRHLKGERRVREVTGERKEIGVRLALQELLETRDTEETLAQRAQLAHL